MFDRINGRLVRVLLGAAALLTSASAFSSSPT
jgi:hypothetical protein